MDFVVFPCLSSNTCAFVFTVANIYAFVEFGSPNTIKKHRVCYSITKHIRVGCSSLILPNTKKHETNTFPTHSRLLDYKVSKHIYVCYCFPQTLMRLLFLSPYTCAFVVLTCTNTIAFGAFAIKHMRVWRIYSNNCPKNMKFSFPNHPGLRFFSSCACGRVYSLSQPVASLMAVLHFHTCSIGTVPRACRSCRSCHATRILDFLCWSQKTFPISPKTIKYIPEVTEHPKNTLKS